MIIQVMDQNGLHQIKMRLFKWSLKVLRTKCANKLGIFIGIINDDKYPNQAFFSKKNSYYVYENAKWLYTANKSIRYGNHYGNNDIILIELNLKKATLEFYKNDESQGIASTNIVKNDDTKYKLMISLYSEGDSVEIVNFEIISC